MSCNFNAHDWILNWSGVNCACACVCTSVVTNDDDAPKTIYWTRRIETETHTEIERRIKSESFISWNIIFNIYIADEITSMTSKLPMLIKMNILPFAVTATLKSSQHLLFSCRWANILAMMQLQQQQQRQVNSAPLSMGISSAMHLQTAL